MEITQIKLTLLKDILKILTQQNQDQELIYYHDGFIHHLTGCNYYTQ